MYDNYVRKYLELDIYKRLGISLDELLDRPRYQVLRIFDLINEFLEVKFKIEEEERRKILAEQRRNDRSNTNKNSGQFPNLQLPPLDQDF